MHRQVLEHQVEGRGSILQVMHEERRHGAERLQFPGTRYFIAHPQVQKYRSHLGCNALQQMQFLAGVCRTVHAVSQDKNTKTLFTCPQWNTPTTPAVRECCRVELPQFLSPRLV